jgi:Protein of unknown function (DUF1552)
MKRALALSRRTVLRGLGAAVALPWLEAMNRDVAIADPPAHAPTRMAFLYVPNGIHMEDWTPKEGGHGYQLPAILEPLESFKGDFSVLTGLEQRNADAMGDEGGDHARSLACFLTGMHPLKTDGAGIRAGVSVDQIAAQQIGRATRLPSLEMGIERGAQSGTCDSGYSCAYSSNISWRSANSPMAKEINPRLVFDRLFAVAGTGSSKIDKSKRMLYQASIIDFVREDAQQLRKQLGLNDRRKIDEYLTAVREIEVRIARFGAAESQPPTGSSRPNGIPEDLREHIRLMFDLLALAFRCDATRICTFMFANEASNRDYSLLNVTDGHHDLSHHGGDKKKHEKLKMINRFHVEQFGYLLDKLKKIPEGEGSLLDNVMIVYGSGIGDGDRHNHDDLPILLAGRGSGTLKPGRHVKVDRQPLNNLFLSMLDRMGVKLDRLGDSSGRLTKLDT